MDVTGAFSSFPPQGSFVGVGVVNVLFGNFRVGVWVIGVIGVIWVGFPPQRAWNGGKGRCLDRLMWVVCYLR